jgi:predicted molibdopterin-dependent oxidoreductase YjgC
VARAARPDLAACLTWRDTADIRAEMARAMPIYAGIERLEREGQSVQWGGERLFADGFTRMPEGRARFSAVPVPSLEIPPGKFHLTTRRGKQFNSMTHGQRDFLMGSRERRDVLIHPDDAAAIGVREGEGLRLRSETGEWTGLARLAPMKRRHLQAYWPETNVLIPRRFDPVSGEPDYNAMVTAEPVGALGATTPAPVEEPRAADTTPAAEPQPAMARTRGPAPR